MGEWEQRATGERESFFRIAYVVNKGFLQRSILAVETKSIFNKMDDQNKQLIGRTIFF
jgi:hypothetical protein